MPNTFSCFPPGLRSLSLLLSLIAIAVMVVSTFGGCKAVDQASPREAGSAASARAVEVIADEYLAAYFERFPETATYYGLPSEHHGKLTDISLEALRAWQKREDGWLAELNTVSPTPEVGSRDWVTFGVLHQSLDGARATRICHQELWNASQMSGWQVSVPDLFEIQAVDTERERADVLARLESLVPLIDAEMVNLKVGLETGYSSPQHNVSMVVAEIRGLLDSASPLHSPLERSDDQGFAARYEASLTGPVKTAIERYADFLEFEYLEAARTEISITANPGGAECYPATIRSFSTVSKTPVEVHQLGLDQMAEIGAEMQQISQQHFGMDLAELLPKLNQEPQFTFPTRQAVIDYHEKKLSEVIAAVPDWFGITPKAQMVIKPYPAYREVSGTGEYQSSSEDGTRPGIFFIPTRNPQQRSIAGQESLLFHEGYPGHHLQGAIALELGDSVHPIARYLWNSGYGEGWGLYSERLGGEMGLFSGPIDRLGMLSDQAARAARLVVDTGLHSKGWSRQRAIDYMLANTAWPPSDIEVEVDRYIIMPGQATSYMLGMLEIMGARQEAKDALGDRFEIREFHDRVLENGSVTLPMLREKIRWWIQETSGQ